MIWSITHFFRRMSRRAAPDKAFVKKLRVELEDRGFLMRKYRIFRLLLPRIAISSSVAFCLLLSTGAYAYSSSSVLPDHFLYPVRIAIESMELSFVSAEKKELVQLKHLQRHLKEERFLALTDRPQVTSNAIRIIHQVEIDLPDTTSTIENEESLLKETVALHLNELKEIVQVHVQAEPEDKEFTREILVDTVQRLEDQVQLIKKYKIEEREIERETKRIAKRGVEVQRERLDKTSADNDLIQNGDDDFVRDLLKSETESDDESES